MKLPKWNGTRPGTYIFWLVCFLVGFVVVTGLTLGQVKYDDREGPEWNPMSTMPDGKTGLSEFAIGCIGLVAMMGPPALLMLLR